MSSLDSSVVRKVAQSIDSPSPTGTRHREDEIPSLIDLHRARLLMIDHDEARLVAQGYTRYEIKASTLRESDIPLIKDKGRISELYDVIGPPCRSPRGEERSPGGDLHLLPPEQRKIEGLLGGRERRKKSHIEDKATEPARETAPEVPVNEPVGVVEKIPEQKSSEVPYVLLDTSALSLLE
ncbi:hypothetical protein F511_19389 [Dorcoceras hygrometricum]|uniref:Uncharacterized protein n=1 Tax=Dorcoceras hygrometricum TaxID=472368 RepID=A0A2Z7C073_9LAMI|nr:hypothetical protein F511_19389 [Dorcoceras hygrometricum]